MRKKRVYDENMPVGKLTEIPDFLPPPHKLVFPKTETVKVTLSLNQSTVNFFKYHAKKNNTKYQKMIRAVVDLYARKVRGLDKV